MPRSEQDSAIEGVPQSFEDTTVPKEPQPSEFTPMDTPVLREKRQPARESGLRGKVVVITGAVAGIGRATALRFAEEGARIAAWDVSAQTAPQLESAIKWAGGESHFQATLHRVVARLEARDVEARDATRSYAVARNGTALAHAFLAASVVSHNIGA